MNVRTQITLDPQTQRRARAKAAELGISFAEYVRRVVAGDLGEPKQAKPDISIMFDLVDEGPPTDIARDKDKMIGEALWQEYRRDTGRPRKRPPPPTTGRTKAARSSVFVDSSVWFASATRRDRQNSRAKSILQGETGHVTTDHVVVETWGLLNSRFHRHVADAFWERIRGGLVHVEHVMPADMEAAWAIGEIFPDQNFSIVDRTSFAAMERLGLTRAASFDDDFAVYRYGRGRNRAFEVLR